jgi:hypothetical protein
MSKRIKQCLVEKFNINNPEEVLEYLKNNGVTDNRRLTRLLAELNPGKFNKRVVVKYNNWLTAYTGHNVALTYIPEYWQLKYNITLGEAAKVVETKKAEKATSRQGFIKRHGTSVGNQKFQKFQKTSKLSSDNEWFKQKFGTDWAIMKENTYQKRSKRCVEFWINKGYAADDARIQVSNYQLRTAGVNLQYYLENGFSKNEASVIIKKINKKKANHRRNIKFLKEQYPDSWQERYIAAVEKYRKTMEDQGLWIARELLDDYTKYHRLVWCYTRATTRVNDIKNIELRSTEWHLDHKYSIKMGFVNDIPAEIIGSVANLEVIPGVNNCKKRSNCSISKSKLLTEYNILKGIQE